MQTAKKLSITKTRLLIWSVSAVVALTFIGVGVAAVKLLLSDDGRGGKRQVQMVTLVKPPPPPKVKEKPPEPEIEKKQEIVEQPEPEPEPEPMDDTSREDAPLDDNLGLDADGGAGADGFGLKAKKGGRSLIGGEFNKATLMRRYAWYTRILQEELRKKVNKHMEGTGGVPDGDLSALVKITLDAGGRVTDLSIDRSSGNARMDRAVKEALLLSRISEPPPNGMPRMLKLKISSKG